MGNFKNFLFYLFVIVSFKKVIKPLFYMCSS